VNLIGIELKMGPPRFELGLPAPQAGRIPSYPTGPSAGKDEKRIKSFWIGYKQNPFLYALLYYHEKGESEFHNSPRYNGEI